MVECVRFLMKQGADVNPKDAWDYVPANLHD